MANKHAASESKDSFYRETFTFSEKELAPEPAADQQRVLIVGFFLTVDLKGDKKSGDKETKKLQKKHAGIVGLKLPAADMVYHLPTKYTGCEVASIEGLDPVDMTTSHALLVVSPCYEKAPGYVKLFALAQPDQDGVCQLFTCPGEGVFYLPEFRDFNKAAESRQRGWNKRVQKLVVKDDGGCAPELVIYGTPRDKSVAMVDPAVGFANHVLMLTSALSADQAQSPSPWLLDQLKEALDEVLPPLLEHVRDFPQMRAFVVDSVTPQAEDLDEDDIRLVWDAEAMLEEVKARWPETAEQLKVAVLQRLYDGLCLAVDVSVAADELEPLLRCAPKLMEGPGGSAVDVSDVLEIVRMARCNVPIDERWRPSIAEGPSPRLLKSVINALKRLHAENAQHAKALRDKLGNNVIPDSPAQLWATFGNVADTDTARALCLKKSWAGSLGLFLSLLEIFWGKRQTEFKGPGVSLALEHLGLELGLSLAPKTWRWLFIVEGAVTAVVAIFGFFLLPNTPLTTSWLTPEERELAHARMERDRVGDSTEAVSSMEGLRQACRDPRTWLFCFMQNFHLSACSFNSFFPTVVRTLGFNRTITLVLTCPPFLFAGAAGIFTGWSSGRMHERTWHITIGLLVAVVGFVIAASTLNTAGRYIACFIFPMGAYSVNSVIIGWASSTLSQTKEKKAVVLAMTNVGGQIGYIYGAYLWPETDKPRYGIGFGASAGFALCSIACAWVIRWMLIKENKKLRESTTEHVNLYGY
ncbi:hypothetical protein HBI24_049300 [Parastagonospora nodorum]|nr:hypothetical protein HBH53_090840 [Parastagonospora nodorum]KAH4169921.1 hypothetical protein HBH43_112550 [Parastagonospora nodorum]KAH4188739.1 hypothetical protein HBI95_229450 [Parastagonospora nodorum]KAH4659714.1 hypothetical protein HBH78_231600 [Parastagonospora nodorum]KAH4691837.1 hypothetical protein HBH67_236980 [Parastagonospora nodorum]